MKNLMSLMVVAAVSAVPAHAELHLYLAGDATISNSWYQAFTLTDTRDPPLPGPGEAALFDKAGIYATAGVLEGDGMTNLVAISDSTLSRTSHDLLPFPGRPVRFLMKWLSPGITFIRSPSTSILRGRLPTRSPSRS